MAAGMGTGSKHTLDDQEYLDSLSARVLMEFRNYVFSPTYIALNAVKFLDHEWIDIRALRDFLQQPARNVTPDTSRQSRVKIEATPFLVPPPGPPFVVKSEPQSVDALAGALRTSADVKMRALNEGGRQIFELLSDSEPEADDRNSDLEVIEALRNTTESSSPIPLPDRGPRPGTPGDASDSAETDATPESSDEDTNSDLIQSDTLWLDGGISFARIGRFRPTRKLTVERMEYRLGPAAIYPIFHTPTAIVVDLSNHMFRDPTNKQLYTLNTIIMNADNDSWDWSGGGSRQTALVTFAPGKEPVNCRRIHYKCVGAHACDQLDEALRAVVRFELDSVPRDAIITAQQETRRREGNSPEERATLFMKIIRNSKCDAVDSSGSKCRGGLIMKPKPQASRGHQYFVGCSGWTTKFRQNHRTHSIPDNVDENLVVNALAGLPLTDDPSKDTPPCSGIIHPHTGGKKKHCSHAHIINGLSVLGKIENYPCSATRSIYVPKDLSIRKVLIVHNDTGHNHPMPALTKMSFGFKGMYGGCINSHDVLGATVAKIDNAQSTKMLLDGKTPSAYAPPLHNKRVKRDMLRAKKLEAYPNGLGVDAIHLMYKAEMLTKPLPERYIHSYIETKKGEIMILTFVPYLLKLLDDPGVTSFAGDTTYKGIEGKLNEWELTIFALVVQRAASVLRAYITGASTDFFEILFDELQRIKCEVTGKPLPFKIFIPDGNLLVTNVDMDAAQVIGLCRSVLKFSDPVYSGIPKDTPPELLPPKFIKVSKKITDWWRHKVQHSWIIPCLVKSQSELSADVWDATPSTTNTNEGQHHWTNSLTGIKLTPVEALESLMVPSRRKVDNDVADEIRMSLKTGILANPNNELSHRMARSTQHHSSAMRKANESHQ
ncbi:hypothetical protein B0H12DRAFT_1310429 [Mycena haematopus]|nr:hypothetical protein B0H12DRAFT_1310429 [Mycena haematopus]